MGETLGKRISANRKRLGMTQDRLAELLGVTAQAVSKWENDQSCPDITMLPKLCEVFGMTVDELLGLKEQQPREEEKIFEAVQPEKDKFEFRWDGGRKPLLGCALWLLLTGGMLLTGHFLYLDLGIWETFFHAGLLSFGIFGLYPDFSIFRLACTLMGVYFTMEDFGVLPFAVSGSLVLPLLLLLLGLDLLVRALKKSHEQSVTLTRNGKNMKRGYCNMEGNRFDCENSFGGNRHRILADCLEGGNAHNSFGELTVDLTGCREFAEDCHLDLECSFGQLNLIVPRTCAVRPNNSTAFASVVTRGRADAERTITADCDVSFGQITIEYV